MGLFGAAYECVCVCVGGGWGKKDPLSHPTLTKLGTVIPYLKKTQKIHKSHDTSLEFC